MARADEIRTIAEFIESAGVGIVFKTLNETAAGIGAVLRILHVRGGSVTARRLCELLGVSSARVAVLLKTMVSKGLVTKEKDVLDARVTVVSLTPFGQETVRKMREELYARIGYVIDRVGYERLLEFLAVSKEIAGALHSSKLLAFGETDEPEPETAP